MAELNFGLLTPPGSQSVGNAFVSGMDQAAAARAQENQNALSQYTLGKAKREDELTNQLLGDLRVATTPEEIYRAYQRVGKPDVASKMQSEQLTQDKLRGEILAQPGARAKISAETAKLVDEAKHKTIVEIAGYPDSGSANAAIDYRLSNNLIDKPTADRLRQGLTPENFPKWKLETLTRMLNPSEQLTQSALKHVDTDRGGYIGRQYFDAQGNPSGMEQKLDKTVSPNTTATIAAARRNHLENLAQQGWTFDTERGIGVNARLGLSKPISTLMSQTGGPLAASVGGAPAVQSGVPMVAPTGVPTGVPGQRQAPAGQPVAGPSVLGPKPEQPIFNAEAQGFIYKPSSDNPQGKFVPVQGMDGKPLNEVQAKSALFGSAMQQSNTVIKELETKGTVKPAVVPGLIAGIVKLAPLGVGDAAANAVESMFRADPTGLVGPDVNQQRLAQAQLGFAIGYLRATSGAAFGPQEVANTIQEYFPLQGEGQEVINQKSAARERAIQGMKISAGKSGSAFIDNYAPANVSQPPPGAVRPRGSR